MAEPRMEREPQSDTRVGQRRRVRPGTRIQIDLIQTQVAADLIDLSLEGCSVVLPAMPDPATETIQIRWEGLPATGPLPAPRLGKICNFREMPGGRVRCGVQLSPMLSLSALSRLEPVFDGLPEDPQSRRTRYQTQKEMALRDLEDLRSACRQSRLMQLQILLMGVPILLVLLGPIPSLFAGGRLNQGPGLPWWLLALPMGSLLFSFLFYTVFLNLAAGLSRTGSLTLILERSLTEGCFPVGYRGSTDACSRLEHAARQTDEPPAKMPADLPAQSTVDWLALPLLQVTTATFIAIPVGAALLMWWIAVELGVGVSGYTVLVVLSTVFLVAFMIAARGFRMRLRHGDRSFRYYYWRFETLLSRIELTDEIVDAEQ